jgi:hypothetical protein
MEKPTMRNHIHKCNNPTCHVNMINPFALICFYVFYSSCVLALDCLHCIKYYKGHVNGQDDMSITLH